jgi:peroxiredoxin/uncharacterized protein YciI
VKLDALLAEEPFVKEGFMQFSSVTEFHPAQHQPLLTDWFAGAPLAGRSPSKVRQAATGNASGAVAQHFLLEGEHLAPFNDLADLVDAHRQFLQTGHGSGHFLFSGSQIPPGGGFLVARPESREDLDRLLAGEPLVKAGKMRFSRVTQFVPAQNAPVLNSWFQKMDPQEHRPTLPERLAAYRANFEAGGPPYHVRASVPETMNRATAELIASGAAERVLKAGDRAPQFILKDADGQDVSSRGLLASGPLVVTFYRGFWCPYCNMDLQALQDALPAIGERGARLVAISPQTQSFSSKSQRENKLTFPILSDPGNEVAASFGLRFKLPAYLIDLYCNTFKTDLSRINGDSSWTLPMPARYVIGMDGVIAYAEVNPDYTRRPDPEELLPVLSAMDKSLEGKAGDEVNRAQSA